MKIIKKLPLVLILMVFQFCKSQSKEKYIHDYNKNTPKLQQIALLKQQFYGGYFADFLSEIENKGAKIIYYSYRGETDISPRIYKIHLNFISLDNFDIARDNKYQLPFIIITFQDQIPDEIRQLTLKNHGELTQEVKDFLANRKIEKIEFYGINGLNSKDRSAR